MGRHVGISHSTVQRIWSKNELKLHITRTFKLSNDPQFEEKFWDVITVAGALQFSSKSRSCRPCWMS